MWLINIVLPIYLIVLLGWLLAKYQLFDDSFIKVIPTFLYYVVCPAIIFHAIINEPISALLNVDYILAYLTTTLTVIAMSYIIIRCFIKLKINDSLHFAFTSSLINTAMLAFPIYASIVGIKAALPFAITVIINNIVFNPAIALNLQFAVQNSNQLADKTPLAKKLLTIVTTPILLAAITGVLVSFSGIKVWHFINNFSYFLGNALIPCALFCIGIELKNFKLTGNKKLLIIPALIKLIISPFIAFLLAIVLKLPAFFAVALVIFNSVPTLKLAYVIASKYQRNHNETAAIICFETLLSVVTIPVIIYFCQAYWPQVFQTLHR